MRIRVNGESRELEQVTHVAALMELLAVDTRQVAVEKNREIVPKSRYAETVLREGDEIEIVSFIGGG